MVTKKKTKEILLIRKFIYWSLKTLLQNWIKDKWS